MKRAIKSFFGIKSKSKKDKDHLSENTRTSAVNSTLNSAADPHRRSSNSNRLSVIAHEGAIEPYGPRPTRDIIEVQQRLHASTSNSAQSSTPLRPRPRPLSEIAHNHSRTRTRSATVFNAVTQPEQTDVQAARRLYFRQPQLVDRGAGVGGPAPATLQPSEGSSSDKSSQNGHIKKSQSTRASAAAASQVVYGNETPCQTYHCVARSSPPLSTAHPAQDRSYGADLRQEAAPDDNDTPFSIRNSSDDSDKPKVNRKTPICDFGTLRSTCDGGNKQEDYAGKVDIGDREKEQPQDSAGVCIQTTPSRQQPSSHQNYQHREQDHGYGHGQGSPQAPQYRAPYLERSLPPLPHLDAEPNPISQDDPKKRFSVNSLASRSIFNKQSDSGVESCTSKKKTPSFKGKGTNRSNTQPDASTNVSPKDRQFNLDVDQFIMDNVIPDLEKHPYRISLKDKLRVEARAHAQRLAEEREFDQAEAILLQQYHDDIATTPRGPAPTTLQEPTSATSQPQPLSIQPKGAPSIPILSISDSPPSRTTSTTVESKRLSNTTSRGTSRGTARRIKYSADFVNGLPKGHIARECNSEIVPTKRLSANSARTNNTSARSYTTTHVMTTADNLDGVPGGPAPAAVTLIIRPESRGKSPRIINKQEFNNTFGRSSVTGSIHSGPSESEERGSEQYMDVRPHNTRTVETKRFAVVTTKERVQGRDANPERGMGEFLDHLSDKASIGPRAGQHVYANPQDIMSSWLRPARMRSLDVVLNCIDWLPLEDMDDSPFGSNTSIHSILPFYMPERTSTPPIVSPADEEGGEVGDETAPCSLDDNSISNSASTESTDDSNLASALIAEPSTDAQACGPPVLINGLTVEELINSVRFESDREGSPGFYGPREFERDQARRRKEAQAKKEQEKTAAKVAKAATSSERIMGMVSTLWSQMTQTTVPNTTPPSMITE
ncbi:hypothetical protein KI688_009255 [Linnemannia hyalina]|uniref:Uncharacterized protein n=1 Tax=Linnemannia hyalina TaxID=64524 RepID=A0A9P7XYZ6_9FUNG|nr:hypothetical protein KI688_009255 [Linnemannia hyalina]